MGNFNITIRGVGSHHNQLPTDVDQRADRFVAELRKAGVHIDDASITYGGAQTLFGNEQVGPVAMEGRATAAFNAYNAAGDPATANKTFDGRPVPSWADLTENVRVKWRAAVEMAGRFIGALLFLAAVAALMLPTSAQAAEPSITGNTIADMAFSPGGLGVIFGLVTTLFGLFKWNQAVVKRRIALAAYHAFHVVEDIAAEDTNDNALDKAALGLKAINDYLVANGWRTMKPGEETLAKLQFQAMNGQQKAAEKVATNAVVEALTGQANAAIASAVPSAIAAVPGVVNPPTPRD